MWTATFTSSHILSINFRNGLSKTWIRLDLIQTTLAGPQCLWLWPKWKVNLWSSPIVSKGVFFQDWLIFSYIQMELHDAATKMLHGVFRVVCSVGFDLNTFMSLTNLSHLSKQPSVSCFPCRLVPCGMQTRFPLVSFNSSYLLLQVRTILCWSIIHIHWSFAVVIWLLLQGIHLKSLKTADGLMH